MSMFTLLCTLALAAFGQAAPPQQPCAATSGDTAQLIQQVMACEEARRLAMLNGNADELGLILADDITVFWGDGTVDDKPSTLALFRSGRLRYATLDFFDTRVRVYGSDTAVVTGQGRVKAQSDEQSIAYLVRVTRVYVREDGRWHLVAVQTTRVAPTK